MSRPKTRAGLSPEDQLRLALNELETIIQQEGLEAVDSKTAVEMAAFDAGYQRRRLPSWLLFLGTHFRIDVEAEYRKGLENAL